MPTEKKTPEQDFKRFENWVEGMEDKEFEVMMELDQKEGGFSPRQKELASQLREEVDEEEVEELITEHRDALRRFYSRWN